MSKLKQLEKLLTDGKITRREFIARVSALGLAATVSPALLAAKVEAATPIREWLRLCSRLQLGDFGCID